MTEHRHLQHSPPFSSMRTVPAANKFDSVGGFVGPIHVRRDCLLENRIRILGLPTLVLLYDDKERHIGEGQVRATLAADRHELVRVLAGRRTRAQILKLAWTGDPGPFVDILSEYGPTSVVGID